MAPVCEGAGSYFALEQSLVIFVMWPNALVILCSKFGQNNRILVVSHKYITALRAGNWDPCNGNKYITALRAGK